MVTFPEDTHYVYIRNPNLGCSQEYSRDAIGITKLLAYVSFQLFSSSVSLNKNISINLLKTILNFFDADQFL